MATGRKVWINTNKIEGAWAHAKLYFRQIYGTSVKNIVSHLCEIIWRNHVYSLQLGDVYSAFFNLMKEVYPLDSPPKYTYNNEGVFPTWKQPNNANVLQDTDRLPEWH